MGNETLHHVCLPTIRSTCRSSPAHVEVNRKHKILTRPKFVPSRHPAATTTLKVPIENAPISSTQASSTWKPMPNKKTVGEKIFRLSWEKRHGAKEQWVAYHGYVRHTGDTFRALFDWYVLTTTASSSADAQCVPRVYERTRCLHRLWSVHSCDRVWY